MCYWVVVLWYTNVLGHVSALSFMSMSNSTSYWENGPPQAERVKATHKNVVGACPPPRNVTKGMCVSRLYVMTPLYLSSACSFPTVTHSVICLTYQQSQVQPVVNDPRSTSLGHIMTLQRGLAEGSSDQEMEELYHHSLVG